MHIIDRKQMKLGGSVQDVIWSMHSGRSSETDIGANRQNVSQWAVRGSKRQKNKLTKDGLTNVDFLGVALGSMLSKMSNHEK